MSYLAQAHIVYFLYLDQDQGTETTDLFTGERDRKLTRTDQGEG